MQECRCYQDHRWQYSTIKDGRYQAVAFQCAVCRVGHLFELTWSSRASARAGYCVFPPVGNLTVSDDVALWAISTCEGTIAEMREDGIDVERAEPLVGGPRPSALGRHTNFSDAPH